MPNIKNINTGTLIDIITSMSSDISTADIGLGVIEPLSNEEANLCLLIEEELDFRTATGTFIPLF